MSSGSTGYDSKTYEHIKYWYDTQAWLPKNARARQQGRVRRARQADAGGGAQGRRRRRGARLARSSEEKNDWYKKPLTDKGMKIMKPSPTADGRHAARSATIMLADWQKKAGADGQAVIDAYRK